MPCPGQGGKGVLVGAVVADVNGQSLGDVRQGFQDVKHGLALVPVQTRQQLEHHLARALAQAGMAAEGGINDGRDGAGGIRRQSPHVHGERVGFAFQQDPPDSGKRLPQFRLGAVQVRQKRGSLLALQPWPANVEAVTAGVDKFVETDQAVHVGAVAAADDGYRTAFGHRPERTAHGVVQNGQIGTRHNGRQGAVVIQKHDGRPALQLPRQFGAGVKGRRQTGRGGISGAGWLLGHGRASRTAGDSGLVCH